MHLLLQSSSDYQQELIVSLPQILRCGSILLYLLLFCFLIPFHFHWTYFSVFFLKQLCCPLDSFSQLFYNKRIIIIWSIVNYYCNFVCVFIPKITYKTRNTSIPSCVMIMALNFPMHVIIAKNFSADVTNFLFTMCFVFFLSLMATFLVFHN